MTMSVSMRTGIRISRSVEISRSKSIGQRTSLRACVYACFYWHRLRAWARVCAYVHVCVLARAHVVCSVVVLGLIRARADARVLYL